MKKSSYQQWKEGEEYKRLMKVSDTPDERDKDSGILKWIAFLIALISLVFSIYVFIQVF